MSAFFTGWCACGVLWSIDTHDSRGIWVFAILGVLNLVQWRGSK